MILCEVSTYFGIHVLLMALQENGHLQNIPKILLISDHAISYEIDNSLYQKILKIPHISKIFTKVIKLNEFIAPLHPREWKEIDDLKLLLLKNMLTEAISFGKSIEYLYLESIQVPPAYTLARIFDSTPINIYSDGLMSFSPTRFALPYSILARIENLFYLDIYLGLKPPLLREANVTLRPIALSKFKKLIAESTDSNLGESVPNLEGIPLFVGQYLAASGIMTPQEEIALYANGLAQAAICHDTKIVAFKPHPSFSNSMVDMLLTHSALENLNVILISSKEMLESILLYTKPKCIISIFSTGAALAKAIFNIKVYSYKSDAILYRLHPWENSNRIPMMLFALTTPDILEQKVYNFSLDQLQFKINIVASSMQPMLLIPDKEALFELLSSPQSLDDHHFETEARQRLQEFTPPKKLCDERSVLDNLPWSYTDSKQGRSETVNKKATYQDEPKIKIYLQQTFSFVTKILNKSRN